MPALEVEGLARHYGEREALSGVSLTLEEGRTLVVFGPNGAGKTTLLRVLASLLRPHAGAVRVLGASLPAEAWSVCGRIGLLGHEPLLYRELTARENLRFHARLHGVASERVDEVLDAVAMSPARERAAADRSRAGWSSAWRSRARCCTSPSCCCSTSRTRTSTRRRSSSSRR